MKLRFFFSYGLLVAIFMNGYAQSYTIKIQGTVTDRGKTSQAISGVKVFLKSNPDLKTYTDAEGQYELLAKFTKNDTLVFSNFGFETYYHPLMLKTIIKQKTKSLPLNVSVSLRYPELKSFDFVVQKVDTVFGSKQISVEDFVLLDGDRLLLLVYEKTLEKGSKLVLTSSSQKIIDEYTIPCDAQYLYTDYAGSSFVVCDYSVYLILIRDNEIHLRKTKTEDFYGFHQRVIDSIENNYYYSDYNELYPAVRFLVTNRIDSSQYILREVKDDFMMELYRAQYKYVSARDKLWAYRKEQETGIDKEIWIGASSFTNDILYKPIYAPLFVIDNLVYVFDQYKGYLFRFDEGHQIIDSLYINYHINKNGEKWEQPLIKDCTTNAIYTIYNSGGYNYIRQLNTKTGQLVGSIKLNNRYVDKIKIDDNYVYYTYRPFESLQKKFLYKEKLRGALDAP